MSDYEKGRQTGLGGAWDPHGDIAGQLEGQRQREQAQAADREMWARYEAGDLR